MNRLQAELHRLYLPDAAAHDQHGPQRVDLVGADGRIRAMVLELAGPAGWDELSKVWRGVQVDFDLPSPGIAVSGVDRHQLWFSLAESVQVDQAIAFLEGLCRRYLGNAKAGQLSMTPSPAHKTGHHLRLLPPAQVAAERWSAFVAPDLAPLFADEPWLDHPPGADAQADLLSRLKSTPADAFRQALDRLAGDARGNHRIVEQHDAPAAGPAARALDPKAFLLEVMRDPTVDLSLRVEAAKALLPHVESGR